MAFFIGQTSSAIGTGDRVSKANGPSRHQRLSQVLALRKPADVRYPATARQIKPQPTVATVSDINKLRTQPFFTNAKNGERVLIFKNTKKAIIYRPSTNQIIEIAPIIPGTEDGAVSASLSPAEPTPTQ